MALTAWLVLTMVWLLFTIPVLLLRRHVDRHAWPAWTAALKGDVAQHFTYLRELFEGDAEMVRRLAEVAERHRQRNTGPARERLRAVFALVEDLSARVLQRLDEWLIVCRAALALYPLAPPPVGAFHLRSLRWLAGAHALAHWVPVTSGERFRLRLRMLDLGFRRLRAVASKSRTRLASANAVRPREWRTGFEVAQDFGTLSTEALTSAEGLLRVVGARSAGDN